MPIRSRASTLDPKLAMAVSTAEPWKDALRRQPEDRRSTIAAASTNAKSTAFQLEGESYRLRGELRKPNRFDGPALITILPLTTVPGISIQYDVVRAKLHVDSESPETLWQRVQDDCPRRCRGAAFNAWANTSAGVRNRW